MKKSAALLSAILLLTSCARTSGITETETGTEEITVTTADTTATTDSETTETTDSESYFECVTEFSTDSTELTVYAHNAFGEYCMPKREALEKLGGVTKLHIIGEFLGDLNEITALTSVTDLEINANTMDGIGAAAELPNLKRLTVSARHGADLSALPEFTGLEYLHLNLRYTAVDLEQITGNADLTDLAVEVQYGEIANIDALSRLTKLKNISLITDGSELETDYA